MSIEGHNDRRSEGVVTSEPVLLELKPGFTLAETLGVTSIRFRQITITEGHSGRAGITEVAKTPATRCG